MIRLRSAFRWARSNRAAFFLLLAASVQTFFLLSNFIPKLIVHIWPQRRAPAAWRTTALLFSEDYANYIEFVKDVVPADAMVLIPKEAHVWNFGNLGLMQYFLYPRSIIDCPVEGFNDCILSSIGPSTFILAPNSDFPPQNLLEEHMQFIPYDGSQGIYIPKNLSSCTPEC